MDVDMDELTDQVEKSVRISIPNNISFGRRRIWLSFNGTWTYRQIQTQPACMHSMTNYRIAQRLRATKAFSTSWHMSLDSRNFMPVFNPQLRGRFIGRALLLAPSRATCASPLTLWFLPIVIGGDGDWSTCLCNDNRIFSLRIMWLKRLHSIDFANLFLLAHNISLSVHLSFQ